MSRRSLLCILVGVLGCFAWVGVPGSARAGDGVSTIRGTVLGNDGKPAGQVEVKLYQKGHKPLQTTTTDDRGKFSFTGLDAGDYVIQAGGKRTGHGRVKTHVGVDAAVTVGVGLSGGGRK